jgi:hypothetical protein
MSPYAIDALSVRIIAVGRSRSDKSSMTNLTAISKLSNCRSLPRWKMGSPGLAAIMVAAGIQNAVAVSVMVSPLIRSAGEIVCPEQKSSTHPTSWLEPSKPALVGLPLDKKDQDDLVDTSPREVRSAKRA